jgi:hypothetical protein
MGRGPQNMTSHVLMLCLQQGRERGEKHAPSGATYSATTSSNILSQLGRPNTVGDRSPLIASGWPRAFCELGDASRWREC